jgi:hypothetical protein
MLTACLLHLQERHELHKLLHSAALRNGARTAADGARLVSDSAGC